MTHNSFESRASLQRTLERRHGLGESRGESAEPKGLMVTIEACQMRRPDNVTKVPLNSRQMR